MNLIVVVDENWGIGKDDKLLFRLPPDMRHFKEKTTGKVVVMGKATLLSLPGAKPLPGRQNIVLSRDPAFRCEGAVLCRSMEELATALMAYPTEDVFVIGGATVYNRLMDCCTTAYVTRVQKSVPYDTAINPLEGRPGWQLLQTSEIQEYEGLCFTFNVYENSNVKPVV